MIANEASRRVFILDDNFDQKFMNRKISNLEKQAVRKTMRMNRTNLYELVRYSEIDQKVERLVFDINLSKKEIRSEKLIKTG